MYSDTLRRAYEDCKAIVKQRLMFYLICTAAKRLHPAGEFLRRSIHSNDLEFKLESFELFRYLEVFGFKRVCLNDLIADLDETMKLREKSGKA